MIDNKIINPHKEWQATAVSLYLKGMTKSEVAAVVDKPRSTVGDFLRKYDKAMQEPEEDNSRILWISDLHAPWHHAKVIEFLKGIKEKYKPTRIVIGGDEGDLHSLNMHGVDPDMPSAGDELKMLQEFMKELAELFPVADIMESNHTSLAYRRAFKAGIAKGYMKSYKDMLGVPDTWVWHDDLMIKLPNGQDCYFCHGKSADGLKLSKNMGCNVVQGHYHSKFSIQYWSNPRNLFWSMQAGCLIDDKSLAMKYNKLTLDRPIIGTGLIIDSHPVLVPMKLN